MIRSCPVRRVLTQADQPLGLVERQRLQQHAVDHAEDRGGGADAERQRQDGRGREGGLLPERARGVAQVLPEIAQQVSGWIAHPAVNTTRDRGRYFRAGIPR